MIISLHIFLCHQTKSLSQYHSTKSMTSTRPTRTSSRTEPSLSMSTSTTPANTLLMQKSPTTGTLATEAELWSQEIASSHTHTSQQGPTSLRWSWWQASPTAAETLLLVRFYIHFTLLFVLFACLTLCNCWNTIYCCCRVRTSYLQFWQLSYFHLNIIVLSYFMGYKYYPSAHYSHLKPTVEFQKYMVITAKLTLYFLIPENLSFVGDTRSRQDSNVIYL